MLKLPRRVWILGVVLVLQAIGLFAFSRPEAHPNPNPLETLAPVLGDWHATQRGVVEEEILDVLQADDLLSRLYQHLDSRQTASLFIAYFYSQREGKAPHSPKNCLPGSGWVPTSARTVQITPADGEAAFPVNRYLVTKGEASSVVLYWYQSRDRKIASEYAAKFYLVLDSLRYNRSDTALVRVVVPTGQGSEDAAVEAARDFASKVAVELKSLNQFRPPSTDAS